MAKFETGYSSIDEAIKDGFAKIGGKSEALSVLETGWYQKCQRKEQNMKAQAIKELVKKDSRYREILENAEKQLGRKIGSK